VRANGLVFTSGQAGRNRDTGQLGDARDQTRWALRNISAILEAAGSSLDRVVKVTVYLKDGVDPAAVNEEYKAHFAEPLPARSSVFVSRLKSPEMLVEIEAVATVG
jgi:2-iminobutanoate/2-iminopropanoate deaminase